MQHPTFSPTFIKLHHEAGFPQQGINDETLQKFGKLVVQECVKITLHSQTTPLAAERIKAHFG